MPKFANWGYDYPATDDDSDWWDFDIGIDYIR